MIGFIQARDGVGFIFVAALVWHEARTYFREQTPSREQIPSKTADTSACHPPFTGQVNTKLNPAVGDLDQN